MHVDDCGLHCILVCPDQLIYNHFASGKVTKLEMPGYTCCSTTWISREDLTNFELLLGYRNGEIWHVCYEVSENKDEIKSF